jgi:hypothetical protein
MSIYRLSSHVRNEIDEIRKRFLWYGGNSFKKKISFNILKIVYKNKAQGGLGLLNLKIMNKALLMKWLVKFNDHIIYGK